MDTGYLICSHKDPVTVVLTETDQSLSVVFRYELDTSGYTVGLSTAFLSDDVLYMISYNSDEQRYYVTAVDKITGQENVSSFVYTDFVPEADEEDSMGGFLFDSDTMWVKNGILYFTETYYKGPLIAVFGAYDLAEGKSVCFETVENAQIIMAYREHAKGEVSVLINPMDYQPLELYTIDDTTMGVKSVTQLKLPSEYLTRQDSEYAMKTYYLFAGDMDGNCVAVLFGDAVSRKSFGNDTASDIMVIYDHDSGKSVWRGRLTMDMEYEINDVIIN